MRTKRLNINAPLLAHVPCLLPDELLYSFLGRLAAYNAHKNPREYLLDFFGTNGIVASVDLPIALASLQRRLGEQSPFDSLDQMIDLATLYPYHRPFLSSERAERVRSILLNGGGGALKVLMGRVANRFGANPPLRFCPLCRRSDVRSYGAPYWHRIHQLPGVTSCAKHGIDLVEHIRPSESSDRQRFRMVPLSPEGRKVSCIKSGRSQVAFAKISAELLAANCPTLGTAKWQAAYLTALGRKGFVDANGRILYDRIAKDIRNHYKDFVAFQHRERILSSPKHPLVWLRPMFEQPDRSSHPILHLLLIGFLFGSVRGFVRSVADKTSARTAQKTRVQHAPQSVAHPDQAAALLKNPSLSCRQVASILKVSVSTIVSRRRAMGIRVSERRKLLHPKLIASIELALSRGTPPAQVAKRFRVSVATVYRLRRQSPRVLNANVRFCFLKERKIRRNRWRKALKKSNGRCIKGVRCLQPSTYSWLYRNDRAWLFASIKRIKRAKKISTARVDWETRDKTLCEQVRTRVQELLRQRQRPRITVTLLIRPLGEAMICRNIRRLPRLRLLLADVQETAQQYRIYRIGRAISYLKDDGKPLDLWRIQRKAGIRKWDENLATYAMQQIRSAERHH